MTSSSTTTETTASAPPSTPITKTSTASTKPPSTPSTALHTTRRSARVSKRDPIVAPGFGTQRDLITLSSALGLPVAAVTSIMHARGRGMKRRSNDDDENEDAMLPPATPVVNAWADFMQDEGMDLSSSATTTTTREDATTKKSKATKNKAPDAPKDAARDYVLPLVSSWGSDSTTRKTSKKGKSSDAPNNVLVQSGTLDSAMVGRSKRTLDQPYDLLVPTVLLPNIAIRKVIASCTAAHMLAIATDNTVYGWGRNDHRQLSQQFKDSVSTPTELDLSHLDETIVVDAAVGKSHTILLSDEGKLFAVGSNKVGQCGVNSSTETVNNWRKCVGVGMSEQVVQVACGEQFTVALTAQGLMYTTGSSEFGQLGNGETGEYFITANKLAFANETKFTKRSEFLYDPEYSNSKMSQDDKNITTIPHDVRIGSIACGKNHAIAIEAPSSSHSCPRVFTWGCGNYGCLGHGVQADSYRPRHVQALQGPMLEQNPPVAAAAGSHCSLIRTEHGHVYYFGKHRSVGEATMRPSLLDALANNGHVVTHIGGGSQTVVCSTESAVTVAWGQGPCGELGYGPDRKSSAKPQFVSDLDKCRIADLACGQGATLYLVMKEDADDEKAVKQLAVLKEGDTAGL